MANREFVFFYAPTWDYPPEGPIKLGNIITSVKKPHLPISCIPPLDEDGVFRTQKRSVKYTKEKMQSGKFSILTKFLSILGFGIDVGAEVTKCDEESFIFNTIDTTQFNPSPTYLQHSIENTNVRRFLQATSYRKPVYVITGIKVVKGAEANTSKSRGIGGNIAVEVDGTLLSGGTVPVGEGPGVEGKVYDKKGTSWGGSSDFVFAFRVSRVFVNKADQVSSEEEYLKGAMLGEYGQPTKELSLVITRVEEPRAEEKGYEAKELMDDGSLVLCAIPQDEELDGYD
ncbi:hypothetical protein N0V92_004864 [Colletotrichum tropicale]|nr:hypothetical protein N0V92_004864 [Colletotrichum tropicale]